MALVKSIVLSVAFVGGITLAAWAQPQYPFYPYPYAPPPRPPSWSYDPYTSGLSPCPQWHQGDTTPCREQMPPTYGQPDYWPPR